MPASATVGKGQHSSLGLSAGNKQKPSHAMVAALSQVSHRMPFVQRLSCERIHVTKKSNSAQPNCLGMCASFGTEKGASNGSINSVLVNL
jgi:hypothetical protein